MQFLTDNFISQYDDFPDHADEISKFTYYRTYSRYLPDKQRRETWKETCRRAVEFNIRKEYDHLTKIGEVCDTDALRAEAEELFDNMFNLRQFLSGRTLWVGGAETKVGDDFPMSNFNCSFTSVETWEDIPEIFYLLLLGVGVGIKATPETLENMPPVRSNVSVISDPYEQYYPVIKEAETTVFFGDTTAQIYVGDSKEGWVEALRKYFDLLSKPEYERIEEIRINYNYVRPKGAKLKTFGGTASGHEPLKEMFENIDKVIKGTIDPSLKPPEEVKPGYVKMRPIHIMDICNLIGYNCVVGGVRRTAEIFLMDSTNYESMFAKYGINGIWDADKHQKVIDKTRSLGLDDIADWLAGMKLHDENVRPLHHRRMSNNSIAFTEKPSMKELDLIFAMMEAEGEPGFINLEQAARRRLQARGIKNPTRKQLEKEMFMIGLNPCAEIILRSKETCNLTTVNVDAFVRSDGTIMFTELLRAQELSARAGLRMTLVDMELENWDDNQKHDRLLGTSLTGWQDAVEKTAQRGSASKMGKLELKLLKETSRETADDYAKQLRIPSPLMATTVKPEGTLSQVANGVSNGMHFSHAPYYIRRIRINAADPLAKAMIDSGFTVHPEVGTPGETHDEQMENARTYVIDFPKKSPATITKNDVSALEQLDIYFDIQKHYTEHNASNTISIKPDEWDDVCQRVYDQWNDFVAVSFLAHDGGSYALAPYEEISEQEYEKLIAELPTFDPKTLEKYETGEDFDLGDGCESGACPTR